MDADHTGVCKYASADDDNYEQVSFYLVRLVKNAVKAAVERARFAHLNVPTSVPSLEHACTEKLSGSDDRNMTIITRNETGSY